MLVAVGVSASSVRRRVLGVKVSMSEAEVHWKEFFADLQKRDLHGVKYIVSDNHAGLVRQRLIGERLVEEKR